MSTIAEVRPTGTVSTTSTSNVGGAASFWQALNDNSNTTYTLPTALGNFQIYDFGTYSLAGNERIEQVQWALTTRSDVTTAASNFIESAMDPVTGVETAREQQWAFRSVITKQYFGWKTRDPNGNPWTQAVLDRLQLRFGGVSHGSGNYTYPRFYEAFLRVQYDTQPTIATPVMGPLETSRPAFSYVYTDADLDPQVEYQAKVFSAAQYGAGGFDPDVSTATWGSGIVKATLNSGATQSGVIGVDLAPGTTYRLYAKAARNFQGVDTWYSAWGFVGFTTVVSLPEVPTIFTTADQTNARVQIDVQARINALSAQDSSLEATGVGNWASAANCTVTRVTTDASHGTGSLQLSSTAGGNMSARIGTAGRIACTPGVLLTAVADFRAAVSLRSTRIDIEWYNTGGGLISTTTGTAGNDAVGSYTQRVCTAATAPALTTTATVLVNVLATGAGAEVHRVDRIGLTVGTSNTWGLGGYLPTADHQIEVSDDAGVTWTRPSWLRATVDQSDQFDTIYDYAAPRGTLRQYRARTEIETPTVIVTGVSNVDSETLNLPSGDTNMWWLKDMADPTKNFVPRVASLNQVVVEDAEALRVDGRTNPIVIAGTMGGEDGTISLGTLGLSQWRQLQWFVTLQRGFLLQGPDGQQWMIRIIGDRGINWGDTPIASMLRETNFPYVEQDET
jgi:hypothetical protein